MTITRRRILAAVLAGSALALSSLTAVAADNPKVEFKTNMGAIVLELYPEMAPKTVDNFLRYVKAGQYKGTIFHRVINGFMIQGGGFDKNMKEKPTRKPIPLEARYALEKGLKNDVGTIAMARTNDPNSATAQFFINVSDNDFLNHQILPDGDPVEYTRRGTTKTAPRAEALLATAGYTPFGKVIQGMDVVEKIKAVEVKDAGEMQNVPVKPVIIESAKIIK
ncbi:peptidylprolyl isomerase [Undibacterium sp.]|uniref:peptidylprolyl isomerase n=1 Tax=Undibacterium sp. TaxID=1914977 RepID=UPI002CD967DD|nr:peptidylprolyl isomerase [Undibacterium sp.]HTD06490.1 peptidylprolyl isomerase [Undibacterium sp.]